MKLFTAVVAVVVLASSAVFASTSNMSHGNAGQVATSSDTKTTNPAGHTMHNGNKASSAKTKVHHPVSKAKPKTNPDANTPATS